MVLSNKYKMSQEENTFIAKPIWVAFVYLQPNLERRCVCAPDS